MTRRRSDHRLTSFVRLMRSDAMRWLMVLILVPVLTLGTFGGAQFLVHGHDDQGTHWHRVSALTDVLFVVADHASAHEPMDDERSQACTALCDHDGSEEVPCEIPEGVIVSIDVHKQLPVRGKDLGKSLLSSAMFVIAVFIAQPSPDRGRHAGSPGGARDGPLDLFALRAGDRIVRTSRALLI